MLPFMDCRFPPLRQWLWAILWSTLFTSLFLVLLFSSERCFFLYTVAYRIAVCAAAWIWLYFFFLLSHRTRLILVTASALFLLLVKPANFLPAAVAENRALTELRALQGTIETYRKENPRQGYPHALTKTLSKESSDLYKIDYQTFHSKSEGPTDGFLLQFTLLHCECGLARSFAAAEDGKIHVLVSQTSAVPATKTDPTLE
jgi:hypothetical protein